MPLVRVTQVIRETDEAHTLVLEPDQPFDYRPGQFLTLRVPTEREGGAARCYSLCSTPSVDAAPMVTVKRTRDGYASNWICDNVEAGHEIEVLAPAGTFTPSTLDHDLLLIAGGSGITPVLAILKEVLHSGTGSVHLVYANAHQDAVIFRERLGELAAQFPDRLGIVHWLESVQGLPNAGGLRALLAPYADREAFICGPQPFMDLATEVLADLHVPRGRVHVEVFSSLDGDPFAEVVLDEGGPSVALEVELDGSTTSLDWPESGKLLDVLLAAGLPAPYSCREGNCSACACILQSGEVELEHNAILDATDLADGIILACQARPLTPTVKVSFDA